MHSPPRAGSTFKKFKTQPLNFAGFIEDLHPLEKGEA
jgi:hypothetical protein